MVGALSIVATAFAAKPITIQLKHNSEREQRTKAELERVLTTYDLKKYTFTNKVIIEDGRLRAQLSGRVTLIHASSCDSGRRTPQLLTFTSSCTGTCATDRRSAKAVPFKRLRMYYPRVPGRLSRRELDTVYSTYGHLVDCYLEMQAGPEI